MKYRPIALGAALIIVIVGFCWIIAGHQASNYKTSYVRWQAVSKPALLHQTSSLPAGLYARSNSLRAGTAFTQAEYDQQVTACKKVSTTISAIEQAKHDYPNIGFSPLGFVNSSYRHQVTMSKQRSSVAASYFAKANTTFSQLATDCTFENTFDAKDLQATKLDTESEQYYDTRGTTLNGKICNADSCVSSDPNKFSKQIDVYDKILAIYQTIPKDFQTSCLKTSLKSFCKIYANVYETFNVAYKNYNDVARKNLNNSSSSDIVAANTKLADINTQSTIQINAHAAQVNPAIAASLRGIDLKGSPVLVSLGLANNAMYKLQTASKAFQQL